MRGEREVAADVVERARQGDHAAFTTLVRHYDERLRALAFRLLGDRSAMDDALQEAYVKAYRALPRFRPDRAAPGTWLYRIVYNACIDELRKRRDDPFDEQREEAHPLAAGVDEQVNDRDALATALATIPADQRAAVVLVDAEGFDYRSAAEILGVAEGTVASRVSRARAALRQALESGGGR